MSWSLRRGVSAVCDSMGYEWNPAHSPYVSWRYHGF
nr:MAG TPA: Mitochondrial F1F0-ATP synthase, subunit f [Caudoviricetes sp.]